MSALDYDNAFQSVYNSLGNKSGNAFLLKYLMDGSVAFYSVFNAARFNEVVQSSDYLQVSPFGFTVNARGSREHLNWELAFQCENLKLRAALELIFEPMDRITKRGRFSLIPPRFDKHRALKEFMRKYGLLCKAERESLLEGVQNISNEKRNLILAVGSYKDFTQRFGYNKHHKKRAVMTGRVVREKLTGELVKHCEKLIVAHLEEIRKRIVQDLGSREASNCEEIIADIVEALHCAEVDALMSEELNGE